MTKAELRIRAFSSGIKKLDIHSLNYIQKLTHILFLVENPPVYPGLRENNTELKKKNRPYGAV